LVNPAFPSRQLTGVFNLELARMYGYLGQASGRKITIVYDLAGYDEVSLTGPVKIISPEKDVVVFPEEIDMPVLNENQILSGETVEESAAILIRVLQNQGTKAQTNVVLANAGLALSLTGDPESWKTGIARARQSLESGAAWAGLQSYFSLQPKA